MPECLSDVEIAALATNQALQRDRSVIDSHLATCAECRSRLDAAKRNAASSVDDTVVLPKANASTSLSSSSTLALEGYDVLDRIQGGGQGVVFKAMQKSTSRLVAVKILPHEETASARQKQRFEREVSLAASLRHPNIVTIYDSGLTSGRYFFAMEYIHGKPLDEFSRTLDQQAKLRLFAKVCDAVAHAHQRNVVHRDLKPGNILVDARGEPHVLDFGLAKTAGPSLLATEGTRLPVTLTSQFMGTLAYASPEQTMGDPMLVDRRSDVYSLGVLLFEMLTGGFPYKMPGDLVGTFEAIRHSPPVKPSHAAGGSGIDRDLDTIVLRALAKEPSRRYQSAEEFASDVHRYLEGKPIAARQDSALYVSTTKAKAALRRHPALTALGVIVAVTLIAAELASRLLDVWPAPGQWFERIAGASGPHVAPGALDLVRVVAITPETEDAIESLAAGAHLAGVSMENWKSIRRVHGRLMRRLATAGAAAAVWDIEFPGETEFDSDFATGVTAMHDSGAGVVVGILKWLKEDPAQPPIAPAIRDARVLWGGNSINVDPVSAWKIDLVVRQPGGPAMPSLALAGLSAVRQPGLDVITTLSDEADQVELQYRSLDSRVMQAPRAFQTITLSAVRQATGNTDDESAGLSPGALVGLYALTLPDDATLAAATKAYHDVFAMSDESLREWCKGRAIVFCDNRPDDEGQYDRYEAPGGRLIWGGQAHAIALDGLLRGVMPARYPRDWTYSACIAIAAAIGLGIARTRKGGAAVRLLAVVVTVAIIAVLSVAVYRMSGYLLNPLAAMLAAILAFFVWGWLDRVHALRLQSPVPGSSAVP